MSIVGVLISCAYAASTYDLQCKITCNLIVYKNIISRAESDTLELYHIQRVPNLSSQSSPIIDVVNGSKNLVLISFKTAPASIKFLIDWCLRTTGGTINKQLKPTRHPAALPVVTKKRGVYLLDPFGWNVWLEISPSKHNVLFGKTPCVILEMYLVRYNQIMKHVCDGARNTDAPERPSGQQGTEGRSMHRIISWVSPQVETAL